MNRRLEAEIIDGAIRAILKHDPTVIQLDKDALASVAERLGISRSTLGSWRSKAGRYAISAEGVRAIARHLQAVGAHADAREFIQKIVCNPLGMSLDGKGTDVR